MDRNPFISQNSDLFIMLLAGITINLARNYVPVFTVQSQFLVVLTFAFLCGLFMSYLYQSIEWAFFFVLGIQIVALTPFVHAYLYENQLMLPQMIANSIEIGRYSCFLLSSWIIGIPAGLMVKKLVSTNYHRRGLF